MDGRIAGGWGGGTPASAMLVSLHELNRRFLALAGVGSRASPCARVATLSPLQQAAAANCPYALFDLRFEDEAYWTQRLQAPRAWQVADAPLVADDVLDFARLALFYVWHVACTAPLRAQLLLGMPHRVVTEFARQTVDCLPGLAATEARHLAARWQGCDAYWNALIDAAARPMPDGLRRAQLRGIQFAAAARLAPGAIAATAR